jgi:hypothetical protein
MGSRPRLSFSLCLVALAACGGGGGGGATRGARTGGTEDGAKPKDAPIGDLALAKGGLPSLGGAGNREESPPPGAVLETFRLDLVEPGARVKVDGVLGEWPARIAARTPIKGVEGATAFAAALQYDDAKIYVAMEVVDKSLVRTSRYSETEDHASLVIAFPTGGTFVGYEVGLFAGKEGEVPGEVRFLAGGRGDVPGAKIVEAPTPGGYTLEAVIPWSAFPEARTVRVGLRGTARYYDAEGGAIRTILATGPGDVQSPTSLAWVPTETEQSIIDGLLIPKQLSQTPRAEMLIQTTFNEENAEISPDGNWLAYQSNESGQDQIYVRPFPKIDGGRWQISTAGGSRPLWARSGRELFYLDGNRVLMAVPVRTTPSFSAGNPSKVFDTRYAVPQTGRTYDVSPDGRRFLMIKESATSDQNANATPASMVVVLNWFEELKRLVPTK